MDNFDRFFIVIAIIALMYLTLINSNKIEVLEQQIQSSVIINSP